MTKRTFIKMELDSIDKDLLNIIQAEFPLSREPFSAVGLYLGIAGDEVIRRIDRLKTDGIIRLIGPVFDPQKLGYRTTLVASKVPVERLDKAGQIISRHPMVSHCYQRDHDLNLWFTLAISVTQDIEAEVCKLGNRIKSETIFSLPANKTFKIGAYFDIGEGNSQLSLRAKHGNCSPTTSHRDCFVAHSPGNDDKLSTTDRVVINALQQDLPLSERPLDLISAKLQMDTDIFLNYCQNLLERGIMRRFSASVNHNKLGFTANAMACWKVPSDMVDTAGKKIAMFREVSHCYERQTNRLWPYNLFAMTHALSNENCRAVTDKICLETGLNRHEMLLLFSTKEIKKTRVNYKL
jgi:DNA-binding Lrp family transcriptional regulator